MRCGALDGCLLPETALGSDAWVDAPYELGPGDYLAWDPTIPHDVENIGKQPGRLLLIYPRHGRRPDSPC